MSGYIYLIHLREFINANQIIYKIGKTKDVCCRKINTRFTGYSKDSNIKLIMQVSNVDDTETKLIKLFDGLFEKQTNLGNEYYKGDCNKMILEICKNTNQQIISDIEQKIEQKIEQNDNEIKRLFTFIRTELCNKIIYNEYYIFNIRNIYDLYGITSLYNINSPFTDKKIIIDIDKFVCEIKKLYENPSKNKIVTSEQYYNFCGIMNTLSRLMINITSYEQKRMTMPNKDNYIMIKLTKPVNEINYDVYKNKIQKCSDCLVDCNKNLNYINNFPS